MRRSDLKRLEKLEAAVHKGPKNCPDCRYRAASAPEEAPGPPPRDAVKVNCEICGAERLVSLDDVPPGEREIYRLALLPLEESYKDPRVHAARLWKTLRLLDRGIKAFCSGPDDGSPIDPESAALTKPQEEFVRAHKAKNSRLAARYGSDPFPEQTQLLMSMVDPDARRAAYSPSTEPAPATWDETLLLARAGFEKIVCGEARPETISQLADFRRRRIEEETQYEEAVREAIEKGRRRRG